MNWVANVVLRSCFRLWRQFSTKDWKRSPRNRRKWSGCSRPWRYSGDSPRNYATTEQPVTWLLVLIDCISERVTWESTTLFDRRSCFLASLPSCFSSQVSARKFLPTLWEVLRKGPRLKVWIYILRSLIFIRIIQRTVILFHMDTVTKHALTDKASNYFTPNNYTLFLYFVISLIKFLYMYNVWCS